SGVLGSALAMDKDLSKRLFRSAGVPTAEWRMLTQGTAIRWREPGYASETFAALGAKVVVKPSKQGSTVGLSIIEDPAALADAVALAFAHDDEVMLEAFVPGRELTVGVLAG